MAVPMENYMKNNFPFYGIKTDKRRQLFKEVWKANQEEVLQNPREIALQLFKYNEREMHYCAIEILTKNLRKNYRKDDNCLIEKILTTHSWWDSVDTIAKFILGQYLTEHPEQIRSVIGQFSDSKNMWLNRSAILFQLGYKQKTNATLLFAECVKHSHSKEFFIQKAIGWALREYGKSNPNAVLEFVSNTQLKPLSQKEALKNIT